MKAMEEVVEFLGEFCGDKVAGVGKGTDLVGSLQKSFNPEMKLPSTSAFAGCFVSMKLSENAHKKAFKKKETLAPEVMEKTITVIAVVTRLWRHWNASLYICMPVYDFFDS
ncbi:hypothetical protein V6N13_004583 [Hibiscus sabdariffa]|uniref:Uncharacterized protein n=1 Tax=Hibiscus sabdariffa TaxID=183260 RepID=A0ABR2RYW7_9ROSI